MGASTWSNDFYKDREALRTKTGKSAFAYDAKVSTMRHEDRKVHEKLNPKGVVVRESRDSKEHPNSLAISVMFDVTGSMRTTPMVIQKQLPRLMGLLTSTGFVKDPQILFGCVGDEFSDSGSLQVGQFESGIEMDDDLGCMWLEGGGGGSNEESYQNALYFFARHTSTDCFEKRGKKGYLFIVGDEHPYPRVSKSTVAKIFGDTLQEDIPVEAIVKEAQEKYHVYFIIPQRASHGSSPALRKTWSDLLGAEHVLTVQNEESISELVSLAVALNEGVDLAQGKSALEAHGGSDVHVNDAVATLRPYATARGVLGVSTDATIRL